MKSKVPVKSDYLEWLGKSRQHILVADPKKAVKFLRTVKTDYARLDLRKPIHPNTFRKIERDVKHFFQAAERPDVQFIRPAKKNRALYSDLSQQHGKWKVYAVPAKGKLKVKKVGGVKVATVTSANVQYLKISFNRKKLAANPEAEVRRLFKIAGKRFKYAKILVGIYMMGGEYLQEELVIRGVKKLMQQYAAGDNTFDSWLNGLEFATFTNQKEKRDGSNRKRKRKKTRREKIRGS